MRVRRAVGVVVVGAVVPTLALPPVLADPGPGWERAVTQPAPKPLTNFDAEARKPLTNAKAVPATPYEMPFPCGQKWTGSTRSSHSPSSQSVDWNRTDDIGDPVAAAWSGKVITADTVDNSGYGRYVVIDHGNNERSLYAHLQAVQVTLGQTVDQGAQIGLVGESGNVTGPHLHFEERLGSSVVAPYFHRKKFVFSTSPTSQNCVDVPLAADFNGNGTAEPAVFRRTSPATFHISRPPAAPLVSTLGTGTDDPVVGDWDGNKTANVGIRRPSTSTFTLRNPAGNQTFKYGIVTDKPISGDWDGNKKWEVGLWRASTREFLLRPASGATTRIKLGDSNDLPVTGDWDGNGKTDIGVFDQATAKFTLRKVDKAGIVWTASVVFGKAGDLPVVGDWDGNKITDLGAWTPGTGKFSQRRAPSPTGKVTKVTTVRFGNARAR